MGTHKFFKGKIAALCSVLLFSFSCSASRGSAEIPPKTELRTVSASDTIEHLFTHCLISHPEIAFREGNEYGKHLDRDCLTPTEFRNILLALYEGGYALVDVRKTYEKEGLTARRIDFSFPKEKKPLVLSFDDVVYAQKNQGKGMSDKLVLTDSGEIAAYTKNAENPLHKREFLPILEDFIQKHPDFSYDEARGVIFLTGFDGVLGYRTQRTSPNRDSERKKAEKLVAACKQKGWIFGSHSYAHGHMRNYSPERMKADAEKWKNEVEPIVGKTELYAYPYGEWVIGENCSDERAQILLEAGYFLFFGVGENPFYVKMPLQSDCRLLFQDRCPMDGVSLRANRLARFFDCQKVYDDVRPVSYSSP